MKNQFASLIILVALTPLLNLFSTTSAQTVREPVATGKPIIFSNPAGVEVINGIDSQAALGLLKSSDCGKLKAWNVNGLDAQHRSLLLEYVAAADSRMTWFTKENIAENTIPPTGKSYTRKNILTKEIDGLTNMDMLGYTLPKELKQNTDSSWNRNSAGNSYQESQSTILTEYETIIAQKTSSCGLERLDMVREQEKLNARIAANLIQNNALAPQAPTQPIYNSSCSDPKSCIYYHESGNNPASINSGGCYGIGQDCNGVVQAKCGTDYACQDAYFTNYAISRYGSWANAWAVWQSQGWW